jgi:hypothetical protein
MAALPVVSHTTPATLLWCGLKGGKGVFYFLITNKLQLILKPDTV